AELPPKPAPPATATEEPVKPKPDRAKESVFLERTEDNQVVFVKGQKNRRIAGRAEDSDLVIKDSGASRKHCELFFDGTLIHVKDLNSANGTYLNDKQVHMAVADDGDVLEIGEVQFKLIVKSE
ncbi:MAG: FHA domain-containing protein, partial [Verrucomicrobiota bacterium]